jgi:anti-sigma28 factor (negative regulator of flagellin synthesis)
MSIDIVEKELLSRKDDIEKSLVELFEKNMKITDWDVPEANDQKAAEILVDILSNKLDEIKHDIKNGNYRNF